MSPQDGTDAIFSADDTASTTPPTDDGVDDALDDLDLGRRVPTLPPSLMPTERETRLTAAGGVPAVVSFLSVLVSPVLAVLSLTVVATLSTVALALDATDRVDSREAAAYLIGAGVGSLVGLLLVGLSVVLSAFAGVVV